MTTGGGVAPGALSGRVALVTGASSGLGRAAAVGLAQAGADVILLARSEAGLRGVAAEIQALGRRADVRAVDLAGGEEAAQALESAVRELGRLDILVNNAATDVPGPVVDLAPEDWDRVLGVNLRAPFLLARAAFPLMRRVGGGTIINVSSVAGKRGWANASAYCASKFALTGFTQALAAEGKSYGIRACVVYPGAMATHWGTFDSDARKEEDAQPSQAPSDALPPERVAQLLVWICASPPEMVLNEVIVTPLNEGGWP
ncbi:SDR family oxidoreductase [Deinococcus peraridilitoris]|uniref:Short-chain alcohol dehydrogenase n=1 Tax=Deinococcus peraridilitoris (strain DSM 19664 / LMG 22246 / CIP 109416 / KR-200) TaxID=937777 RepID=K9ZZ30_DEIPD|nr:SDR family oxidoreductase [Deinococcus peraridilitoris]AFZ66851.1 short-chain alcohol dehydrogenase [Deinococcus peraridilitoris DSM 19664]